MSNDYMLTTNDNPYNPFEQFVLWNLYDVDNGYNTCSYLARLVNLSDDLSDTEIDEEIDRAMDEIIFYDFRNIYKRVREQDFKKNSGLIEPETT